MNQFGCPKSRDPKSRAAGTGGPPDGTFKNLATGATETRSNGGNIKDENISKDSNKPGTLSMANTGQKNSGGSQLFMNVNDNKNLDWFTGGASKHPVFGKLVDKASYDLAVKISSVRTREDNPVEPVKMVKVRVAMGDGAPKAMSEAKGEAKAPPAVATGSNPIVTFETSMGSMDAEIYLDRVPRTASNFLDLASSGFYNGLHFHRVIPW